MSIQSATLHPKQNKTNTALAPFRWKSYDSLSLKVISQSHLSFRKQYLSKNLIFAKFSDEKTDLLKQLQEMVEINSNTKTTDDTEIRRISLNKSAITSGSSENEEVDTTAIRESSKKVSQSDDIAGLLRRFEKDEAEKEKDFYLHENSQYNNYHHDNFHEKPASKSDFFKELKSCDVSVVNDKLEDEVNRKNVKFAKNLRKSYAAQNAKQFEDLENFDENRDYTSIQNVLKVVINQELQLCPNTTVWLASLISSNLSKWKEIQNLEFMASQEFIKFFEILLTIIPNLDINDILFHIYPFYKKLPECFGDILFYKIFTFFEDEVHKKNERNTKELIDMLQFLQSEKHIEAVNDLIDMIDEELISLYKRDREHFFTLPVRHNLSWALRGHTDNDFRSKVLLFLTVLPNNFWIQHNISYKYGKVLYSMNSSDLDIKDFEEKYFKKVESLSNYLGSFNEMIDFIYWHGKAVQKGQTTFQRNLVHISLNNIIHQSNLSFNSVNKLVSGLQNLDHYSYKFAKYLAEFFIIELHAMEKDIMQYIKFLSMLANYDCLSLLKDDWPHFKFLLENSYFVSNKLYWSERESNWLNLLDLSVTLSLFKIYPEELLEFLSQKINKKKISSLSAKYLLRILQLNRAIHFSPLKVEFLSAETLVLAKEKVNQINIKNPGVGFKYSMSILEEIKKSMEIKFQLNDCVLIDCYTDLGHRIPLLMAFDMENKLYSLHKFRETKKNIFIKELQLQENIKLVAVQLFLDNAFISSFQEFSYLKASHSQNVQSLELAGCHVEHFKYCDILNLPVHERGSYIYEIVKTKLNDSGHNR